MTDNASAALLAEIAHVQTVRAESDREIDAFLQRYDVPRKEAAAWVNWEKARG